MFVLFYALTRILLAISQDQLLPEKLSVINKKTQTPVRIILLTGIIISVVAGLIPLGNLAEIVNIGTLTAFIFVCFCVLKIRKSKLNFSKKIFKNKFHPLIPCLSIFSCTALVIFLPTNTWLKFIVWNSLGLFLYFIYGYKNSNLNR